MTADKTPSAQSRQNSASMNPLVTTLGVVLACAVIGAYSALTPGVELKWSAQRSLQQTGRYGQHTVYVARSATWYESGLPDDIRSTLVARTSVQTREKDLDSASCAGPGNSTTRSWRDQIAVKCWNGCHRAPNMGTSLGQYQITCDVHCAQSDGVIGCDLSNQGDKVGMTTSTTPHGDHRLTTSHQAKVDRHRLSTRHLKQGISVKRPRDPGRYMARRYMAG